MIIRAHVEMNLVGCRKEDEIEVPDDVDEDEIEEIVKDWLWDQVSFGWEKANG